MHACFVHLNAGYLCDDSMICFAGLLVPFGQNTVANTQSMHMGLGHTDLAVAIVILDVNRSCTIGGGG